MIDNYEPIHEEGIFTNLKVIQGSIPKELSGVLFRNGPNPQFPSPTAHSFEGDGMVHAIALCGGEASYQNKWVRTAKFLLEQQEGRSLFHNFGMNNDPIADGVTSNTANTNIIYHGQRLLALVETEAATEIRPENLETIGEYDFSGKAPALSAHPHIDYSTGEILWHNYTPFTNDVNFYVMNEHGNIIKNELLTAPYSSFMHDMMFTENFIILPVMPLTFSLDRLKQGKPLIMFESDLHSHFAIMPRSGGADDAKWFQLPAFYIYHFMNAYERDGKIIVDGFKSDKAPLFSDESGKVINSHDHPRRLTRLIFDLSTGENTEEILNDLDAEFPAIDNRFMGRAYKHAFAVAKSTAESNCFDALLHFDLSNHSYQIRHSGTNNGLSEPTFIPKDPDAPEGEGFLLTVVFDQQSNSSHLLILDAMNIEADPIATVAIPHRIPYGFHGNWVNGQSLTDGHSTNSII